MSHSVQRGALYQTAPQIPDPFRQEVIEGRWWNGSRLFIYEIVSSNSSSNYYVVSFNLFERFLNAFYNILRKDYLGDKVKNMTRATTVRHIDQAELRRLTAPSTSSTSPPAPPPPAAATSPSPSRVDDKKTYTSEEGTKIDSTPATQPPARNETVVRYLPFNQWSLTEIDQRAFNIIYQRLIDPNSELVLKSCATKDKHDFVFVKMTSRATEYFDGIRSNCQQGIISYQDFYLVSSVHPIAPNDFPFGKEYFSVCVIEKENRYRWPSVGPVIDWESSSSLEVQRQAALFLLRIFKFSIESIQSIPVISEKTQKLDYTVIGSGKGFSKIDKENINRLSQRILGFAVTVERSNKQVHFAVGKVEDARREAKDRLYLALPHYLVATTVRVNESHFDYNLKWPEKVILCKPGSGENFINWDDPESVRQVAMFFLRIYEVSLVSFGARKAVA